ncbi:MAG: hypothetical protein AB7T06_18895 [Kofleriaceae bacterium]
MTWRTTAASRITNLMVGLAALWISICIVDVRWGAITLLLSSIAYIAWTVGRGAGVAIALFVGFLDLRLAFAKPDIEIEAPLVGVLWLIIYVTVALAVAATEVATRPTARSVGEDRGLHPPRA